MNTNDEFTDLFTVKKIKKLRKEQETFFSSDIKNGFIHVNEEKIIFYEKLILEDILEIKIPVSFYEGSISNDFSNHIFFNFDASIFIECTVLLSDVQQKDLNLLWSKSLNYIKKQGAVAILSKGDFLTSESKKIFYAESLMKGEENDRYYLFCFFQIEHYFILTIFCCMDYRVQDWKTVFFQMAQTIKSLEKEKKG